MKSKKQLMDALAAKGVEFNPNSNKAELEILATANGIPLEVGTDEGQADTVTPLLGGDAYYIAMLAAKRRAGLSLEQATEVTERQRQTDIELGVKIEG